MRRASSVGRRLDPTESARPINDQPARPHAMKTPSLRTQFTPPHRPQREAARIRGSPPDHDRVIGTVGYIVIEGWSFSDAVYMTDHLADHNGLHGGEAAFAGGARTYGLCDHQRDCLARLRGWAGAPAAVELYLIRRGRMDRQIQRLRNHVILCGYGRMGRHIAPTSPRPACPSSCSRATPAGRVGARGGRSPAHRRRRELGLGAEEAGVERAAGSSQSSRATRRTSTRRSPRRRSIRTSRSSRGRSATRARRSCAPPAPTGSSSPTRWSADASPSSSFGPPWSSSWIPSRVEFGEITMEEITYRQGAAS